MSSTEQAPEPTMDEILASIRRIIADDEASATQPRAPAAPSRPQAVRPPAQEPAPASPPSAQVSGDDDILELTNDMFASVKPPLAQPAAPAPARQRAEEGETGQRSASAMAQAAQSAPPSAPPEVAAKPDPMRAAASDARADVGTAPEGSIARQPAREPEAAADAPPPPARAEPALAAVPPASDGGRDAPSPPAAPTPHPAAGGTNDGGASLEACVRELLRPMLRDWLEDNLPRILEDAVRHELAEQVQDRRRSRH